jgi:hypothetical protein
MGHAGRFLSAGADSFGKRNRMWIETQRVADYPIKEKRCFAVDAGLPPPTLRTSLL